MNRNSFFFLFEQLFKRSIRFFFALSLEEKKRKAFDRKREFKKKRDKIKF